jgi:hypothetical protein
MKKIASLLLLSLIFTNPAVFAQDKSKASKSTKMDWTTVQRENMAKMHENMATCLRSTKSPNECRAEMKAACDDMGKDCPMMHDKGHGGMMHEGY